eukprot:scaffold101366_cov27-Phaeocystis_antarctica.AAC.1
MSTTPPVDPPAVSLHLTEKRALWPLPSAWPRPLKYNLSRTCPKLAAQPPLMRGKQVTYLPCCAAELGVIRGGTLRPPPLARDIYIWRCGGGNHHAGPRRGLLQLGGGGGGAP